jgi:predicted TIM-barrel fold metal-dependent hydrolase
VIIDTHFHGFPKRFLELTAGGHNDSRGTGITAFDADAYVRTMDAYQVDVGILSSPGGRLEVGGHREHAREAARVANDAFAEAQAKYPNRFRMFARPSMVHMDDSLAELRRCVDELGAVGAMLPTNLGGKYLDEAEFDPFWEELARIGKPLFLHPTNAPCLDNWNIYSLHQKMLWPADTTLALSRIANSGILDRYPNIPLIGAHLGGMVTLYLDRLNWWEGTPQCKEKPEYYFKRFYYDTAGPVRGPGIQMVCDTVGVSQVLFGSDYPQGREGRDDQFYPMTLEAIESLRLTPGEKQMIYAGNARSLFQLGPA